MLLCAASTLSSRQGGFPSPHDVLDDRGRRDAAEYRLPSRFAGNALCSPCHMATETANAMGVEASVEEALADLDHGRWAGCSFETIQATESGALSDWLADPTGGTPDGETMDHARQRIGAWLDRIAGMSTSLCAITHPMMIRAALAHALDVPPRATLAIDIAPLSRTMLSFNRIWRLQSLQSN